MVVIGPPERMAEVRAAWPFIDFDPAQNQNQHDGCERETGGHLESMGEGFVRDWTNTKEDRQMNSPQ